MPYYRGSYKIRKDINRIEDDIDQILNFINNTYCNNDTIKYNQYSICESLQYKQVLLPTSSSNINSINYYLITLIFIFIFTLKK